MDILFLSKLYTQQREIRLKNKKRNQNGKRNFSRTEMDDDFSDEDFEYENVKP